jgi:FdhD protein
MVVWRSVCSACGVCGRATIDDLLARLRPLSPRPWPAAESVQARARALRATQSLFELTGGVHGAALFDRHGALLAAHEDVGRHNAVDKVLGARLRRGTPLSEHDDETLVVSSRAGFEIVQKAVAGRVPVVLTVGAATSLADALARAANVRLFSFVRDAGFNRHGDG